VDGFLADLRGEGEHNSEGEFTLDPRQAAEKLRLFQLSDPYHYVLLLAEAAFLGGATFLRAQVSSREVQLSHDGEPGELGDLFERIFTTRVRPDLRSLGLGLNAALRLAPQCLTVECGEQRLQVSAEGNRVESCPPAPHWRVTLRHRLGWQMLKKVLSLTERQPEADALSSFCRWAPARVEVNGQALVDRRPAGDALLQARIRSSKALARLPWNPGSEPPVTLELPSPGNFEAVLTGFPAGDPQQSQVELIVNGVWAGRRPLPNPYLRLLGAVSCPGLERNVSRTDVVDTPALQRILRQVKLLARELLKGALRSLRERPAVELGPLRPWLLNLLREQVRAKDYAGGWEDEPRGALIELPLFHTPSGLPVACRPLLEQYVARGTLLVSGRRDEDLPNAVVVQLQPDDEPALRRMFSRFEDAAPLFEQQAELNRERSGFLARPPGPATLPAELLARLPWAGGELGLGDPGQPWRLQLGREWRLLGDWQGPRIQLPAGVVGLAYHDGLTPGPGWNSAASCPARAALLAEAQALLPELYARLVDSPVGPQLLAEHLTNLLDYLARSGKAWPLALPEPVLRKPWLAQVNGPALALADLEPPVAYLLEPPSPGQRLPRPTLLLTPAQLRVLRTLMGKRAWKEADAEFEADPQVARAQPVSEPVITALPLGGGLPGELRLMASGRGLAVQLLERGQVTDVRVLDLPIPRVDARVEAGAHWEWLEPRILARLHRFVLELARRVARKSSLLKGRTQEMEAYLYDFLPWALRQADPERAKLTVLPILPAAGGERRSLDDVEQSLVRQGYVRCAEADPGPGPELVLLAPTGASWLVELTTGRAVWGEPTPPSTGVEPEPGELAPSPPTPRRPDPEDPARRRLLGALRELLGQLEPGDSCRDLRDRLHVGQGVGLAVWEEGEVIVNVDHPWVRPLMLHPDPPLERLALLLSASFSVFNRAHPTVADHEERRFHRSLLERLA